MNPGRVGSYFQWLHSWALLSGDFIPPHSSEANDLLPIFVTNLLDVLVHCGQTFRFLCCPTCPRSLEEICNAVHVTIGTQNNQFGQRRYNAKVWLHSSPRWSKTHYCKCTQVLWWVVPSLLNTRPPGCARSARLLHILPWLSVVVDILIPGDPPATPNRHLPHPQR